MGTGWRAAFLPASRVAPDPKDRVASALAVAVPRLPQHEAKLGQRDLSAPRQPFSSAAGSGIASGPLTSTDHGGMFENVAQSGGAGVDIIVDPAVAQLHYPIEH